MDDDVELIPARRLEVTARFIEFAHTHLQTTGERAFTLEIPARFIASAKDHLETGGERTVTLLIETGEMVCIGVSTRQATAAPRGKPSSEPIPPPKQTWTRGDITEEALLEVVRLHGPIDVRTLGNTMGIDSKDASLRSKIAQLLYKMADDKQLRVSGHKRYRSFSIPGSTEPKMELRPQRKAAPATQRRTIFRSDITRERIAEQLRNAGSPITSRTIGDMLGIPRHDNSVRSKITEVVRSLVASGHVRSIGVSGPFRTYELVTNGDTEADTTAAEAS